MPGSTGQVHDREHHAQAELRRSERRRLAVLAVTVVLLLVGGGAGFQLWRSSRSPSAAPMTAAVLAPVSVQAGQPILLGRADAPLRITLYEDFHCSHCVDFNTELGTTLHQGLESGRLAVALYPMAFIDAGSSRAANAMACAAESGFGAAYYAGLFANSALQWSDEQLVELAALVSPTALSPTGPADFGRCVEQGAHGPWVGSINAAAAANGVTSTPTVVVGGRTMAWDALTPQSLSRMIDEQQAR